MTQRVGWWLAGAFGAGLVVGVVIGYLLFAVLLVLEAPGHKAAQTPTAPQNCPLPYPGQVIPPGCPTS